MGISKESKELLKAKVRELDEKIDSIDKQISPLVEKVDAYQKTIAELRRQKALLVDAKQKYKTDAEA